MTKEEFASRFKPKKVAEWVAIAAAIFLCCAARTYHGLRPFGAGLFVGLAYVRRNVFLLFPLFLLSSVLLDPVWQSVVTPISLTLVLSAAYLIHRLIRRKVRPLHLLIYGGIALLPSVFLYGFSATTLLWRAVEWGIAVAFIAAGTVVCYLVYVKGIRYRMTAAEESCLGLFFAVFALAVFRLRIQALLPSLILYGFLLPLSARLLRDRGVALHLLVGAAVSLAVYSPYPLGYTGCAALACLLLERNKYLCALLPALVHFLFGALSFIADYSVYNSLLLLIGGSLSLFVRDSFLDKILSRLGADKGVAVRSIVNRNRLDIYTRLRKMRAVMMDMRGVLSNGEELPAATENKNYLARELAGVLCAGCSRKVYCERALGAATSVGLYDLVSAAVDKGGVSILDMPAFLIEHCDKTQGALAACKTLLENYSLRKEISDSVTACRVLLCEQLEGLAGMLDSFSREMKQTVSFDLEREKRLLDALSGVNVIASEAVIYQSDALLYGFVVVREEDEKKKVLFKTLSAVLGNVVKEGESIKSGGSVTVSFVTAPRFDVHYGVAGLAKTPRGVSGDVHSAVRITADKVLFAVCDGMGSGKKAAKNSESAMDLVESFYKAGVDENAVLSIINKLLSARGGEDFSALDMCVINLRTGTADFIKLGGVQSVVRCKNRVERVEGGALPIGILENVKPFVCRKTLSSGDYILLVSDGVTDSIGADGLVRLAEQNATANPEKMAATVIKDVEYAGVKDDCTALCIRIYERR